MTVRPRRSVLYMPGSNARALEKAKCLPADALILDLEDAVAPDVKALARDQVVAAVRGGGYGSRELVVRINQLSTPSGEADLRAAVTAAPSAILLPKVSTPSDVMVAARKLRDAGAPEDVRLWIMMETPLAMLNAGMIAATAADPASRLDVMVMGTNDLVKETRARLTPGRASILAFLSICVVAARSYEIDIIDGVFGDLDNAAGLRAECEQGRDLGMDGKTLIHPNQVGIANEVFAPSSEEVVWAKKVIAAFALPGNADKGAIQLDGRMVERLHGEMAQRTIAVAETVARQAQS